MKETRQADASYEWYAQADLRAYKGKYVAIVGKQVAASGKDPGKVYARARRRFPRREIALAKVPDADILFY